MTDLVERMRRLSRALFYGAYKNDSALADKSADEIERLTAENNRLERAWIAKDKSQRAAERQSEVDYEITQNLLADQRRLMDALTPSGSTKADYHGEFAFEIADGVSNSGIDRYRKVYVPWATVKEIMKAIRIRAGAEKDPDNGQQHTQLPE